MRRRILITGGTGQVGTELRNGDWPRDLELVAPTRQELDLSDCGAVEAYIVAGGFSAVINSGAYTAVDRAESDVTTAWKVNALAPATIAAATKRLSIPIVHLSTDYVFDGAKDGPYQEDDKVSPLGVYGASKEAGEQAVRTGNPRHVIVRTAWVFSPHGSNFVKTMLRIGSQTSELRVVEDQYGCPTSAADIASAISAIVVRLLSDPDSPFGTYHFVNSGQATWCEFARQIFSEKATTSSRVPNIVGIKTAEYPTAARRPLNSRLSTDAVVRDYGVTVRPWTQALKSVLNALEFNSRNEEG